VAGLVAPLGVANEVDELAEVGSSISSGDHRQIVWIGTQLLIPAINLPKGRGAIRVSVRNFAKSADGHWITVPILLRL